MIYNADDGRQYKPASRWIHVNFKTVTNKHSLSHYAAHDGEVSVFRHNGKQYTLEQFMPVSYPITVKDKNGDKYAIIGGVDSESWYNPYLLEVDPNGDSYIRLWKDVEN